MADETNVSTTGVGTVTEKKTGDAATQQPPPPAVIADDSARKYLALASITTYGVFISLVVWLLVFHSDKISSVVATLIGTILGTQASNVGSVYQYYYGSSSGSTAKSAVLDKKP